MCYEKKTPNDNIFCTSKAISLNWFRFVKVLVVHKPFYLLVYDGRQHYATLPVDHKVHNFYYRSNLGDRDCEIKFISIFSATRKILICT